MGGGLRQGAGVARASPVHLCPAWSAPWPKLVTLKWRQKTLRVQGLGFIDTLPLPQPLRASVYLASRGCGVVISVGSQVRGE